MRQSIVILLVAFLATAGCQAYQDQEPYKTETISVSSAGMSSSELLPLIKSKKIKNVILLIGDGTGLAQIASGQLNLVGPDGLLSLQTMPVTGIVKTHASDNLITDSAAGATSYSCGIKTYNGAIAVNPEGKACKTILELAEEKGLSTGLVATSSVTHATPASFAAHVEDRGMENEIAAQLLNSEAEVLLGGGLEFFQHRSEEVSAREDDRDLINEFESAGYSVVRTRDELASATGTKLLGLFARDGLERNETEPQLPAMTRKALEILSSDEDGFFLMIEGSQIDWEGHGNDAQGVLREIQDFDASVKAALDFAIEDGETLVVLTADHETGGMTLNRSLSGGQEMEIYWTTGSHTGIPVPLMAYGPQATEFMGWRDNTYIGIKLAELLGVGELPVILE